MTTFEGLGLRGIQHLEGDLRVVRGFREGREDVLESLIHHPRVQSERDAEIGDLVLLSDAGRRCVQIASRAAQVGHDSVRVLGLELLNGLGRVGLVVEDD